MTALTDPKENPVPERVQMTRNKPWRHLHPDAVIVDRGGPWGNPFRVGDPMVPDRAHAVARFGLYLKQRRNPPLGWAEGDIGYPSDEEIRRELGGKDLACWCPLPAPGEPDHCHAAVLLELANPTGEDLVHG